MLLLPQFLSDCKQNYDKYVSHGGIYPKITIFRARFEILTQDHMT